MAGKDEIVAVVRDIMGGRDKKKCRVSMESKHSAGRKRSGDLFQFLFFCVCVSFAIGMSRLSHDRSSPLLPLSTMSSLMQLRLLFDDSLHRRLSSCQGRIGIAYIVSTPIHSSSLLMISFQKNYVLSFSKKPITKHRSIRLFFHDMFVRYLLPIDLHCFLAHPVSLWFNNSTTLALANRTTHIERQPNLSQSHFHLLKTRFFIWH